MSRVAEMMPPEPARKTPRQMIEQWTPGILGDGSELAKVIAVEATRLLIVGGAIPEDRETRAFMKWHAETWVPNL